MEEGNFKFYLCCWQHLVIVVDIWRSQATKSSRWTYRMASQNPISNPSGLILLAIHQRHCIEYSSGEFVGFASEF